MSSIESVPVSTPELPDHEIVIIGAGLSGIGVAAALHQAGLDDFVLLDRREDFGGTWLVNRYPGVAVDVPTWTYQFSTDLKPDWSRVFAEGHEVKDYVDGYVEKYGIRPHARFGVDVLSRAWDAEQHLWRIQTNTGELTARFVVSAIGPYPQERPVTIPGFEQFTGKVLIPTGWDHDYDPTGKRVAVIGTGATAVQIVPKLALKAAHLDVYQRTPVWVLPKIDPQIPGWLMRLFSRSETLRKAAHHGAMWAAELSMLTAINRYGRFPFVQKAIERYCRRIIKRSIDDPQLRDKLAPDYPFGAKRGAMTGDYLPTFNRENVDLVTDPIKRFTATGIETADGVHREIDAVVPALGYRMAFDPELYKSSPVYGRDGFELGDHFRRNRLKAYQGVSMPGLPNHFMLFSAYSAVGASWHPLVENAGRHIVRVIQECRQRSATCAEVTTEATDFEHAEITKALRHSLFLHRDCSTANTYYIDHHGDIPILRPVTAPRARRESLTFPLDAYSYSITPVVQTKAPNSAEQIAAR